MVPTRDAILQITPFAGKVTVPISTYQPRLVEFSIGGHISGPGPPANIAELPSGTRGTEVQCVLSSMLRLNDPKGNIGMVIVGLSRHEAFSPDRLQYTITDASGT